MRTTRGWSANLPDITSSPEWFAITASADFAFVRLTQNDYRAASFLDERATGSRALLVRSHEEVRHALARFDVAPHFIFHVGHVGSTLVSRLVGEHPELFSLREPAALRDLAMSEPKGLDSVALTYLRLLSRTWRSRQTSVVKATSFVSEIGVQLVRASSASRAILMFASPLAYLRGVFGGEASRRELRATAASRRARLERRLGVADGWAPARSEGEVLAACWLAEMASLGAIATTFPERVRWIDFDRFLQAPSPGLRAIVTSLGAKVDEEWLDTVVAGPILRRYSKGPDHPYDARLRQEVAMQAEREHGAEIARGMAWLGQAARSHPEVRRVLEEAAERRSTPFTAPASVAAPVA